MEVEQVVKRRYLVRREGNDQMETVKVFQKYTLETFPMLVNDRSREGVEKGSLRIYNEVCKARMYS